MSRFFHLTKKTRLTANRQKNQKRKSKKIKMNTKLLNIVVIGLIVFSGFSYLVQMNSIATKGYKIKTLEAQIDDLAQTGSSLALQVSELQSMENVRNKVDQLNMVAVGNIEYLNPTPVALAK